MAGIEIRKAERSKSKLRLGLSGPSGSGKTMSALKLARGIAGKDGKVCLIDTERGSGDLYADLYEYDIIGIAPPYTPSRYVEALKAAEDAGYAVIILDSLSHAWSDEGGLLDQADKMSARSGNRYTVWADLTPQHRALVNAMLNSKAHIIATTRAKQAYEMEEYTDSHGNKKSKPVKLGMAPVQREGMEYEFTVFMDIDMGHNATASKDRTNLFKDRIFVIDEKIGEEILDWLNTGVDREVLDNKRKIMHLLTLLDGKKPTSPEEVKGSVLRMTQLTLDDSNLSDIVGRLEVLVQEKKEADALAAMTPEEREVKLKKERILTLLKELGIADIDAKALNVTIKSITGLESTPENADAIIAKLEERKVATKEPTPALGA